MEAEPKNLWDEQPGGPLEEKSVGIFPAWKWLYALVVVYGVAVIGALTLLTGLLDFGGGP